MNFAHALRGDVGNRTRAKIFAACAAIALLAASTGATPPRVTTTLRVFAAASLTDAFHDLAAAYRKEHPGSEVQLDLGGSQQLVSQLENGAAGDVFASADERWMDELGQKAMLDGEPQFFARNRLVVIVPHTNPARIGRLQDLARHGVKVVLAADAVPVGHYSREALGRLARQPGFGADYTRRVLANVVSEEENVKSVLGKVQLGEADAGMVYSSDVTPTASRFVRGFTIPDSANVLATYPIAVLKETHAIAAAREFVALVLSPAGQRILERRGFLPVAEPAR